MTDFHTVATATLLQSPFYGTLLMKLRHTADETIPTLCVSQGRLRYNPAFVAKLNDQEGVFVVSHEIQHVALMHLPRAMHYATSGIGPDGKEYDHELFNIAMDYVVNDGLRESKMGEIPRKEIIEVYLDPHRFPHTLTPEEVYCILRQQGKPNSGNAQVLDGHDFKEGQGPGDKPDPADGEMGPLSPITVADIIQAANVCKATMGSLPAGIDRLMGELTKPKSSPWQKLRHMVTTSLAGYDASTWRRLHRRMIVRGIGVPGRTMSGAGRIGIVADVSGSIDDKMLRLFGGHMGAIIADARPKEVKIYWVDWEVQRTDTVRTAAQLVALFKKPTPGGGGTDMPKGVRAAEADKCDAIVVLTDGYTPFCDSTTPVFWAITEAGRKSPYGKTVNISE